MYNSPFSMRTSNTMFVRRNVSVRAKTTMQFPEEPPFHRSINSPSLSKPIFNADSYMHYTINIQEARDAYECCSFVKGDDNKRDCYLSFGVDKDATERYLQIVENYEQLYQYNTYIPNQMDKIRSWFHKISTP